jgi:hypothetical protein
MQRGHRAHASRCQSGRAIIVCAAIGLASIGTGAASAELAPPSAAPPVAKRKCAAYTVVRDQGAAAAHCKRYAVETLRSLDQRQGPSRRSGGSVAPSTRTSSHAAASGGSPPHAGSPAGPHPGRGAQPAARAVALGASATAASEHSSSGGSSLPLIAAILAGCVLAGGAALALMRGPSPRRRGGDARGAAS